MSGTHRDLLFWSKSRCFASKNHRWRLGPIATSNAEANHAFMHPQNGRWVLVPIETCNSVPKVAGLGGKTKDKGLGPIETCISGANHAVVHAQNDRWYLGHIETCHSGPEVAVLHAKPTGEGWNQYSLFILVLSTLLCVLKTTDEVWELYRHVCLVLKSLFWLQKPQMRSGTNRD